MGSNIIDDDNLIELGHNNDRNDEQNNEANDSNPPKRCAISSCRCSVKKLIVGLILLGLIIFVIVDSLTNKHVRDGIVLFLEWIEIHPTLGVLAFICVYFFATICLVPGAILTLGAGFVFTAATNSLGLGVLLATVAVFIGASSGAIAAFLLSRYLFREGIVSKWTKKYPVFKAIDNALEDKGFRIMFLLRLSPIIPFTFSNYVYGITAVKLIHYCIACFGMIPGTVLYVFLGASAGSLSEINGDEEEEENKTLTIVVIIVGVVFGILGVAVTSYYAKKELNKVIETKEQEEDQLELELESEHEEQQPQRQIEEATSNNLTTTTV